MLASRIGTPVERFGPARLDDETCARFRQQGFLTLPGFLSEAELEKISQLVDDLLKRPEPEADGMLYDYAEPGGGLEDPKVIQLLLPFDYQPALFQTELFENAAAIARQLLGDGIHYRGSHLIDKPPRHDNPTAYHQDEAFWDPGAEHEAIAVWVPLGDAPEASGCMEFVPGSHIGKVLEHRRLGGDPRVHGLELDGGAPRGAVACPIRRGDATVHHCRTVHGTGPNRSGARRRSLILNLATSPRVLNEPRAFPWQEATASGARERRAQRAIELP